MPGSDSDRSERNVGINRREILKGGAGLAGAAAWPAAGPSQAHPTVLDATGRLLAPFSCNLEMWWKKKPFLDRISLAAAAGFSWVEMWNPTPKAKQGITPEAIAERAKSEGVRFSCISPGAPDLGDPANHPAFMDWLDDAIALAKLFEVPRFNLTGHKLIDGLTPEVMMKNYVAALREAAPHLAEAQVMAVVEPYNPFNHPGHFMYGRQPGLDICRAVDSPWVKLNWDLFHMQRTDGNLITHLTEGFDQVGYMQFADSPDRNQPGTGEVSYGPVFQAARKMGYTLPFGAELNPKDGDAEAAVRALTNLATQFELAPGAAE